MLVRVVDTTPIRCPKADQRQRAVLARKVAPPQPDQANGVSNRVLRAKVDELRLALYRSQRIGLQIADELDRCANGGAGVPPLMPPPAARVAEAGR